MTDVVYRNGQTRLEGPVRRMKQDVDGCAYCAQQAGGGTCQEHARGRRLVGHVEANGSPADGDSASVEVLVPEAEAEEARAILDDSDELF